MRAARFAFALLLIISAAYASQIVSHDLTIRVERDNSGYIEEEYILKMANESELAAFKYTATYEREYIGNWYYFGVGQTVKGVTTDMTIVPQMTESLWVRLALQYHIKEIVGIMEDKGRKVEVGLTERSFSFYDPQRDEMVFPFDPKTTMRILIPSTAKLTAEITPPANKEGVETIEGKKYKRYEWDIPFNSKFKLSYERELFLSSTLSLDYIIQQFSERIGSPIYILTIGVLLIIGILYRKGLRRILLEGFAGEDEIDEVVQE